MLSVSTLWYDGGDTGENVGTTEMYEKTLELEEHFKFCDTLDPVSGSV